MFLEQHQENKSTPENENYSLKEIEKECFNDFSYSLQKISKIKKFTDFTCIIGKDKVEFKCHKLVLITSSLYFENYFKENSNFSSITLENISSKTFNEILNYLYQGFLSFNINIEELLDILNTSEFLSLKEVQEFCFERLEDFSEELLESKSFLNLSESLLINLLENNHFKVTSEYHLFERVINWLQNQNLKDSKKITELKMKVFSKIRFTLLSLEELEKIEFMNIVDNEFMNKVYKKILKKDIEPRRGFLQFIYQSDFDDNGIIHYIGCQDKKFKTNYSNPASNGMISVSPFGNTKVNGNINDLFSRWTSLDLWLSATKQSAFIIDFKNYSLSITHYTIRSFSQTCCYLRNWNLEGSNDNLTWNILSQHVEPTNVSLPTPNATKTFQVSNKKEFYRYIRIHQIAQNSSNWNFGLGGIEFYGYLK